MPRNQTIGQLAIFATAGIMILPCSLAAGERITLEVRETAGIRRFGYPVATDLKLEPSAPADTNFRLLEKGKPVAAQFRPLQRVGDRIAVVAVDFDAGFMPNESREYVVEYGPDVTSGPEPDRGMKVEESTDAFLVSHGPNLSWVVPKNLVGLLHSVKTSKWEYLRPDSGGLFLVTHDNAIHHVAGSAAGSATTKATIVKQGPIDCMLRFENRIILRDNRSVQTTVEMEFPRSKSWVRIHWTVDDSGGLVAGLGADLNLNLSVDPVTVDFGAGHYVYAALGRGQAAAMQAGVMKQNQDGWWPSWETFRGPVGKLEPYVVNHLGDPDSFAERWAHAMDRERCTAVALDYAADTRDRIEIEAAGRLQLRRDYTSGDRKPSAGTKSLKFWLHFVGMPPHVGAVTSPQSMQSPLKVTIKAEGVGRRAESQPSDTNAAQSRGNSRSEEVKELRARSHAALAKTSGELKLAGLKDRVEVLRDKWGIPHIYAQNSDDLFFAQGYVQAQDRLWQMEIWRRTTEGRLAEIVGPAAVERDRIARLVRFRGDMNVEWSSYSPDAKRIIESFVRGVNAFIETSRENPPIEFQLTRIKPEPWTPEVCLGRMAGFIMCRNATNEVLRAQLVRELGAEQAAKLLPIDPFHELRVPAGLELDGIDQRITAGINIVTAGIRVPLAENSPSPLGGEGRGEGPNCDAESLTADEPPLTLTLSPKGRGIWTEMTGENCPDFEGSNNWTIAGRLTQTGKPILASDPHRPVTLPSLRYFVHLNCPARGAERGWNVIGGTEPALPGVALGHNDRIAWGMTIVGTDQMDLYVEETHASEPNRYRVGDEWQPIRIERETIRVRGEAEPRSVELKFTRHGPVIFEDPARHRAYALRWTGSEPGTAGYLAALSVDRVENWPEFLEAANRWKIPSLNLVYADTDGHIGWIAAGLTPVRRGWDGLLPVPAADGKFEWDGFLPTAELPQQFDPPQGYIATANHNILPPGYRHEISYEWAAPFRFQRIDEVFRSTIRENRKFRIEDSQDLQHDAVSIPARRLIAKLGEFAKSESATNSEVDLLLRWDGNLSRDSAAGALYQIWQRKLVERVLKDRLPEKLWDRYASRLPLQAVLEIIDQPDSKFGLDPRQGCKTVLLESLRDASAELRGKFGSDPAAWSWGKLHQAHFRHMLATEIGEGPERRAARQKKVDPKQTLLAEVFNLPSTPRPGDAFTPLAAGGPSFGSFDQTTGASYRHIVDLADWDRSVATSVPGQSGQPGSPHYADLLPLWADGKYFPLTFSRPAVEKVTKNKLILQPDK